MLLDIHMYASKQIATKPPENWPFQNKNTGKYAVKRNKVSKYLNV